MALGKKKPGSFQVCTGPGAMAPPPGSSSDLVPTITLRGVSELSAIFQMRAVSECRVYTEQVFLVGTSSNSPQEVEFCAQLFAVCNHSSVCWPVLANSLGIPSLLDFQEPSREQFPHSALHCGGHFGYPKVSLPYLGMQV